MPVDHGALAASRELSGKSGLVKSPPLRASMCTAISRAPNQNSSSSVATARSIIASPIPARPQHCDTTHACGARPRQARAPSFASAQYRSSSQCCAADTSAETTPDMPWHHDAAIGRAGGRRRTSISPDTSSASEANRRAASASAAGWPVCWW